ncbi:MAG: PilT/PilU family type 4a pilus ATPase [Rickettsiales bacterium]|jgi:twitching motility protein PilT|nr:PilT/PilU family type 4a pilus ATPase [Rickettsiales bacterium]
MDKEFLNKILAEANKNGASDIHITSGLKPYHRVFGDMIPMEMFQVLTANDIISIANSAMDVTAKGDFMRDYQADFAYVNMETNVRYRVNIFKNLKGVSIVMRQLNSVMPDIETADYPEIIRAMLKKEKGLILVCGPTGSGKSTTIAGMIDYINKNEKKHIITLEDPVEYVHQSKVSLVQQREIGRNAKSFADGLKGALREDPDIVLIGEMRDAETVKMALTAAETGHLVFGTLHTMTASKTIDRIIDTVDVGEKGQIRGMLSTSLNTIVLQSLLKRKEGNGRVAAFDILVNNSGIANMIREEKTHQIDSMISTGSLDGMINMDSYILQLVRDDKVTFEEAMTKIKRPDSDEVREFIQSRESVF